jgi:hypothetical protein
MCKKLNKGDFNRSEEPLIFRLRRFVENCDLEFLSNRIASWSPQHNPEYVAGRND